MPEFDNGWEDRSDSIGPYQVLRVRGATVAGVYQDGGGYKHAFINQPSEELKGIRSIEEGVEWVERRLVELALLRMEDE